MKKGLILNQSYIKKMWGGRQWQEFVDFIQSSLTNNIQIKKALVFLEIGAREGFVSEIFRGNFKILCSDVFYNSKNFARSSNDFRYININCLNMNLDSNSVDIVVAKSVFGGLKTYESQARAFEEIYRVLRPGGLLIFAENTRGLLLHRILRRLKRGDKLNYWRYMQHAEISGLASKFKLVSINYKGVLSGAVELNEFLDSFLYKLDKLFFHNVVKCDNRLLVFCCLTKPVVEL